MPGEVPDRLEPETAVRHRPPTQTLLTSPNVNFWRSTTFLRLWKASGNSLLHEPRLPNGVAPPMSPSPEG